jgi:E3 ubiquitin-protein ligase MYCBP2
MYSFGTTHFCTGCHDDFQRLIALSKDTLPQCPVGARCVQLDGDVCPLHITGEHPVTGDEYALGCAICRNLSTF